MNIARALIPTWRFFDEVGSVATLYYRTAGNWLPVVIKPQRSLLNLFFNPEGNLYLAEQSLVENLLHDISLMPASQNGEAITEKVSYQLVDALVQTRMATATQYQFKISVKSSTDATYDALVSKDLVAR